MLVGFLRTNLILDSLLFQIVRNEESKELAGPPVDEFQHILPAFFGFYSEPDCSIELIAEYHCPVLHYHQLHLFPNLVGALYECIIPLPIYRYLTFEVDIMVRVHIEDLDIANDEGVVFDVGIIQLGALLGFVDLVLDNTIPLSFLVIYDFPVHLPYN